MIFEDFPKAPEGTPVKEYWLASYSTSAGGYTDKFEPDGFDYVGSVNSWTIALYILSVIKAAPILVILDGQRPENALAIKYKDHEVKTLGSGDNLGVDKYQAVLQTPLNSWKIVHGGRTYYEADSQEDILAVAPKFMDKIKDNMPVYIRQRNNGDLYWLLLPNGQVIDYETGETKLAAPDGSSQADLFELTSTATGVKTYHATLADCASAAASWPLAQNDQIVGVIGKKGYMVGGYIKSYLVWPDKITSALSGKTVDITAS